MFSPSENIRWIGVHLNPRLSLKHNIKTWCDKATRIAHYMKQLNLVSRDAAARLLIEAIYACVIPVATYGSDVWWPGTTQPIARGIVTL